MNPSQITWETYEPPATEAMIAAVEQQLGIRYPADFRAMAPTIHGAEPSASRFTYHHRRLGPVGTSLGRVLSFDPASDFYVLDYVHPHRREGILPDGVVPFGTDGGGDLMAFDFRKYATNPSVVYIAIADAEEHAEVHVYRLADSFAALLAMLEA